MRTDNNEDPEEIQANSQFEKMRLTMNWIIAVTIFFLRISTGPIEFDVGGVKFKGGGAAAPIVFWLICFLSCSLSIALLWQH